MKKKIHFRWYTLQPTSTNVDCRDWTLGIYNYKMFFVQYTLTHRHLIGWIVKQWYHVITHRHLIGWIARRTGSRDYSPTSHWLDGQWRWARPPVRLVPRRHSSHRTHHLYIKKKIFYHNKKIFCIENILHF